MGKRILFLSNRGLLPIKDGHTRRSFNILKGLAENNQVYFLSLFETKEEVDPKNIQALKNICHQIEFVPAPPKKICIEMIARLLRSLISSEPYTVWRHYSKHLLKRVDELISSGQFDLVHCDILSISYTVKNRKNIFCSVTDHDVSFMKYLSMGRNIQNPIVKGFLHFEAWKIKNLERNIFKQVDLGVVVSESDKRVLQGLCPEGKFLIVENGVELSKFNPVNGLQIPNKIVWLGGFDHFPNKQGIEYFLNKIYPLIKNGIPGISVDIVGGGVSEDLRQLSLNDSSINFAGFVDDPLPFLHKAMVFIAPLLSGGGTKLKVLEAMATGKAIVTTSVGCEGINGVSGQHFLVADGSRSFADGVIELLSDKLLRESLQENARIFVQEGYNFKSICRKLDSYYDASIAKI